MSFGRTRHTLTWSFTFLVASIQWVFNLFKDQLFPSADWYWVIVSALSTVTVVLALVGHRQRAGLPTRARALWGSALVVEATIVAFTMYYPHVGWRTAIGPTYAGLVLLWCSWIIVSFRARSLPSEWGATITTAAFAISQLAAGWAAFMQGATTVPYYLDLYLQINFLALPAGYTGMSMFVVLIVASDLSEQMKALAIRDQLTNVMNRRGFTERAATAFAQARRAGQTLALIMSDIDRFKTVNDTHGHAAGDRALQHFARLLTDGRRTEDVVGRVGGEEFAVVLPGACVEQASRIAECLRREVEALRVDGLPLQLTASFGVAAFHRPIPMWAISWPEPTRLFIAPRARDAIASHSRPDRTVWRSRTSAPGEQHS